MSFWILFVFCFLQTGQATAGCQWLCGPQVYLAALAWNPQPLDGLLKRESPHYQKAGPLLHV